MVRSLARRRRAARPSVAACVVCSLCCLAADSFSVLKDYYDILNCSASSTTRDVQRSYRELSLRWHPDTMVMVGRGNRRFRLLIQLIDENVY